MNMETAYEREPDEPIQGEREKGCACDTSL